MITRIGFYVKVEVRSSKPRCKGIPLVIVVVVVVVVVSIAIAALKIGDVLTYSSVPFVLYMVYRPISRFTAYKALFALIAVLTVRGVVSSVSVERFNL
jgi:hypothetical protein